jgi:hypothetical protein
MSTNEFDGDVEFTPFKAITYGAAGGLTVASAAAIVFMRPPIEMVIGIVGAAVVAWSAALTALLRDLVNHSLNRVALEMAALSRYAPRGPAGPAGPPGPAAKEAPMGTSFGRHDFVLSVACPTCKARPGKLCRTASGAVVSKSGSHTTRFREARERETANRDLAWSTFEDSGAMDARHS